jgi:hypothetical protein
MEISIETLSNISKMGIKLEKPIMLDYWLESNSGKVFIGVKGEDKLLVKSAEEFTSPIKKIYNSNQEFIIETENSLYVVSNSVKKKMVS